MSRLQIFPSIITLYPKDRQKFTAKWTPPFPGWRGVTGNGDIGTDFSLAVDSLSSAVDGIGVHELASGIGIIEFTIDDQCRPTTTGYFYFTGFITDVNGVSYIYQVKINSTTVEVRDELNNQIFLETYTTSSGDVYRLELNLGFRFYRNGVLKHSRTGLGATIKYPMGYSSGAGNPAAASPTRIPAPRLIGDWQLAPVVTWTAPTHGSISAIAQAISTDYYEGTTPGTYTLTGAIEAAADAGGIQRATATIIIAALQSLSGKEVTIQPSAKTRFKTNYDAAQNSLIAWSVVSGGGSFSQGEFTAGANPGTTIVRATDAINNQAADITVTVPAVITNANNYIAAKVNEQIDFDTNILTSYFPLFISVGSIASGTGNVTPNLPPGVQKDDLLLLKVESANEGVPTPSGWAIVANSPQGTGTAAGAASTRISVFWKLAVTGFEAPPTVTDPGDHAIAQIFAFRGCPTSGNPWDVTAGDVAAAATTAVSIPGATTTVDKCLIVQVVANATDTLVSQTSGYTNAGLANIIERSDINKDDGNGGGFGVITAEKATAGAFGATTATLATSSVQGRMTIALKPASLTWSASIGSINSSSGLWTAPSLSGQTAKINVTNGIFTVTIDVPVLDVFPVSDLDLPLSWDRNLNSLISMSEDRTSRITRDKASPHDSYPIKLEHRTLAECNAIDAFFDAQGLGKPWILEDKVRNIRKVGWFDSPIRHEARDECDIDLAFQFLEARL